MRRWWSLRCAEKETVRHRVTRRLGWHAKDLAFSARASDSLPRNGQAVLRICKPQLDAQMVSLP